MPSFLSQASLARNPVVDDESVRKVNIQTFMDFFNERDPCLVLSRFPPKPQFSDDDHELDPEECADSWNEVRLARWIVDSNVDKGLHPMHGDAVLEKLDRCRSLAWGKQDHLIFYDKPTSLDEEDREVTWGGHYHRADFAFMSHTVCPWRDLSGDRHSWFRRYQDHVRKWRQGPEPDSEFGQGYYASRTRLLHDGEVDAVLRLSGVDDEAVPT